MKQKTKKTTKTELKVENTTQSQAVPTRGRVFEGTVVRLFTNRLTIESERTIFLTKYERFYKKKTKLHARIPQGMVLKVGDYIKIRECRPLSKIIHFVVIEKVRDAQEATQ